MKEVEKQCVGCGSSYKAFVVNEEDTHFCTPACEEEHSLFKLNEEA